MPYPENNHRSYSELITLPTFAERLEYLSLSSKVGLETFGHDRYLNQMLYHNPEWKRVRNIVISRDRGCDMAHSDFPIYKRAYIHHINPITVEDILNRSSKVFDPENLVCVSFDTHQMIHYGINSNKLKTPTIRVANDTCPWK